MAPLAPSSIIPPESHTMRAEFLDRIAFLYQTAKELQPHVQDFVDDEDMKRFRSLSSPIEALARCHEAFIVTIEDLHRAVKHVKPQITEIIPEHRDHESPLLISCRINGVQIVPSQAVRTAYKPSPADASTPSFNVSVEDHGGLDRPTTLMFIPNGLLQDSPSSAKIPGGMKWEAKADGHIVQSRLSPISTPAAPPMATPPAIELERQSSIRSQLSPMPAHPPDYIRYKSPKNADVAGWREEVAEARKAGPGLMLKLKLPSTEAQVKPQKRGRGNEDEDEEGEEARNRKRPRATSHRLDDEANEMPMLRRSTRLSGKTRTTPLPTVSKGKAKVTQSESSKKRKNAQ
ncbi:hypothetical protein HWV62_12612 [Athelia sp. TMB]|nr:hypothetical protein HWV62_12612 [Athelia sp. TMB]